MPSPLPLYNRSPSGVLFASTVKERLQALQTIHVNQLQNGDDAGLRQTSRESHILRRAVVVHDALDEILVQTPTFQPKPSQSTLLTLSKTPAVTSTSTPTHTPSTQPTDTPQRTYLRGAATRMQAALRDNDIRTLEALCSSVQTVLDDEAILHDIPDEQIALETNDIRSRRSWIPGVNIAATRSAGDDDDNKPIPQLGCCGFFRELSPRDKTVIGLYVLMVIGALIAVTAVTIDFAHQAVNPGSFIRSDPQSSIPSPVVTTCIAQTGVPFSRLQLFNFTDAQGTQFRGADPQGVHNERASKEFEDVVERFWDNPDDEDCDNVVGDFFPFPIQSLNDIVSRKKVSRCRACYRVGRKKNVDVTDTSFDNSSQLFFYTDNYWLQCMFSVGGPDQAAREEMQDQLFEARKKLSQEYQVLGATGQTTVSSLLKEDFRKMSSETVCNMIYFGLFPLQLKKDTGGDVKYEYDGDIWKESGNGPYFRIRKEEMKAFIAEESLQFFVETNRSSKVKQLRKDSDMILIGPNTQTLATLRPVNVYGDDRFDISSSTSNLRGNDVRALFGFWLVYKIYYNYNRFIIDEYYRESTYPVSQWIVDFTGYASLFTGASIFSLLLLPLLRNMKRRESKRLKQRRPEKYVWEKYRRKIAERHSGNADVNVGGGAEDDHSTRGSVLLPGYNV